MMYVDLVDIDGWKSFVTYDHLAGHDHACNIIGIDGWENTTDAIHQRWEKGKKQMIW